MDGLREEPLEERINQISDILTKVMSIVISAIDDMNQKIANISHQFNTLRSVQQGIVAEIQQLKANPMAAAQGSGPTAPIVTPMANAPQAPVVQAAPQPKPAPKPLSPMSARSAINNELKALFSRRKKD